MTASEATFELARRCPLCGWCMAALLLAVYGAVQTVAVLSFSYLLWLLLWLATFGEITRFVSPMEWLEIFLRG